MKVRLPPTDSSGRIENCTELRWPSAFAAAKLRRDDVRLLQQILNAAGYDAGPADGVVGRRTTAAISAAQTALGLTTTGRADGSLVTALLGAGQQGFNDNNPSNDRSCTTVSVPKPARAEPVPEAKTQPPSVPPTTKKVTPSITKKAPPPEPPAIVFPFPVPTLPSTPPPPPAPKEQKPPVAPLLKVPVLPLPQFQMICGEGTRWDNASKRCVSVCPPGYRWSSKGKNCVVDTTID
jgi:hypothetical protein